MQRCPRCELPLQEKWVKCYLLKEMIEGEKEWQLEHEIDEPKKYPKGAQCPDAMFSMTICTGNEYCHTCCEQNLLDVWKPKDLLPPPAPKLAQPATCDIPLMNESA